MLIHRQGGFDARRWFLPAAAIALSACSSSDRATLRPAEVTDSAGVMIVENRSADVPFPGALDLVTHLAPPDSALTPLPWGVVANPLAGRVFVSDRDRVAVFDERGRWLQDFGQEGDGPGEFRSASAIDLDPFGAVAVWDTRRAILSRWSTEGQLLNEQRPPLGYWGPGFAIGVEWVASVEGLQSLDDMVMRQNLVVARGPDTTVVTRVDQPLETLSLACMPGGGFPAPKLLAPSVTWTTRGDTVVYLDGPQYRVDWWSPSGVSRSVRRDLDPIPVSRAMAARAVLEGPGPYRGFMRTCQTTPEEIAEAVGSVESVSPVMWLAVDPSGRLWVTRTVDGVGPGAVDVIGPGGDYLGTLDFPGLIVAFLGDSLPVSLDLDLAGTGEPRASLYRLRALDASPERSDWETPEGRDSALGALPPVRSDVSEFRDCPDCPLMVALPPGRFLMGSPDGEEPAESNPDRPEATERAEKPQVEVEIAYSVGMGKYEVTFAEWDRCVSAGGCDYSPDDEGWGRGDRPVIRVARRDAERYAAWLSEVTGEAYRLPSEAEWEYAARAGTTTARWWGPLLGRGMTSCNGCGSEWDNLSTAPVGSFPPNPFGLHDMLGNVSEWVADCWISTHMGQPADGSARTDVSRWYESGGCTRPVIRGGAFYYFPWVIRSAARSFYFPGNWTDRDSTTQGFRVARTLSEVPVGS